MKHLIIVIIWCTVIASSIIFGLSKLLPLPRVFWSYTEDECVAVYIEDKKCDCSILKKDTKYERIWVK